MTRLHTLTAVSLALLSVSALAVDPAKSAKSKKTTHRAPYTAPSPFAHKPDASTNPYLNPASAQPYANKPNTYLNPAPAYKISSSSGRRSDNEPASTLPAPYKPYGTTTPAPAPAVNNYDASSLYNNPITARHNTKHKK